MLNCLWSLKAIQKGNTEVARIHAENAIRQKNQAINFLRMSARVDAVAARVQTAVTMGKVTKSMAGVVKSMDATLRSMNLEKISALMDKFEHQFETLDVQTQQMEDTMSSTTTLTTPQNQVDMLLQEMADEAGMNCHRGLLVFVIKCNLNNWCFCFLHVCLKQPLCLYIKLHSSEKNIIHARMFEHYLYMMLYFVLCSLQFIKKFQGISTLADFIIRNIMCKGVRDIFLKMSLTKLALIFFILYVFLK
ncbi:charged multivesicular body protein 1b-2 isoform X2 [Alexandromys fortis]|uniref:charged multivesicular body protein 1b-2 isoform X2 n=1 Tax=Alexandromys fortis TaxID=100897 RepID=UPI0021520B66|nr:charged multivesicular body protein 1b-2 isoform X2 [Microtus fortis]